MGLVDSVQSEFGYQAWQQIRTIVAVSGGPDSVALLRAMLSIAQRHGNPTPTNLIVAHVDHGMRGSESEGDAQFVETLAARFGLEFVMANSIEMSPSRTASDPKLIEPLASHSEEQLRNFRYDNLLATATELGARYIVTGHNLNDQIETILFRIFRGTGIAGLSGIPPFRLGNDSVTIARPMLKVQRSEIEAYLSEIGQDFRVDSSNLDSHYQRNYLRNELIPLLESRFGGGLQQSLQRLSSQALEAAQFIESQSESLEQAIVSTSPTSVEIDCSKLGLAPPILVRQFLVGIWTKQNWPRQAMGFVWWEKICEAVRTQQSAQQSADPIGAVDSILNLPGEIRFSRIGNAATFSVSS